MLTCETPESMRPRKTPGKTRTLLIWFAKSERPVATTAACRAAMSGSTSGVGLAIAKTTLSGAIDSMSASVRMFGAETPRNTSAPRIASDRVPVTSSGLVFAAIQAWLGCSPESTSARPRWMTPSHVGDDDVLRAGVEEQLEDGRAGRARAAHDEPDVLELLADDAQGVAQRGERDDRRAVLVVVEDRDVELLAQPGLDLEAARRRDVLEVDAGEHRGDRLDGADDLLGVGRVEADREGVDVGEALEERGLALHDRQRRERADVAEPEHRGAVGDDGDGVALDGQPAGVLGVLGDRHADPGHARACR